jgi:hypothetical protein
MLSKPDPSDTEHKDKLKKKGVKDYFLYKKLIA